MKIEMRISSTLSLNSVSSQPRKSTVLSYNASSMLSEPVEDLPGEFLETDPCDFRREVIITSLKVTPRTSIRRAYQAFLETQLDAWKLASQHRQADAKAAGIWQENPDALRHL